MKRNALATLMLSMLAAALGGCIGARLGASPEPAPGATRALAAGPDRVWARLVDRVDELGWVVEARDPEHRELQLGWMTPPGEGALYLDCTIAAPLGTASIRPRLRVHEAGEGSAISIVSDARATTGGYCESTGQFEAWMLDRLEPALPGVAGEREGRSGRW